MEAIEGSHRSQVSEAGTVRGEQAKAAGPGGWSGHGRSGFMVAFFVLAVALTVARRPDAIIKAQFWAEDGRVWFMVAHN